MWLPSPLRVHASDPGVDESQGETVTTNPKNRYVGVSATVQDITAPSIPILVAPADTSTITTTYPTFIWQPSTDDRAVTKYQLWVDGSLLFDDIPTGSTTNGSYTLVVEDGEMKLTPVNALSQGEHHWYVMAFDAAGNSATSATWSFTIDTQAPVTVITQVGTATTNISSSDPSSVPLTPISLTANEPLISGTSETGATLQLTPIIPGQANQVFTHTISGGTFAFQLGVLPTNVVMTFSIVSSDAAGNTSVISNVTFIITKAIIIIPPIFPSSTPTVIEVPRPIEIIKQPPEERRPEPVKTIIKSNPAVATILNAPIFQAIAEALPALAAAAPLLVATAATIQAGASLLAPLIQLLIKLLQSLGLLPLKKPRGLVFDAITGIEIPFATIRIYSQDTSELIDTVISDVDGVYRSIQFPVGTYRIEASHSDYTFPTKRNPPLNVNFHDYYRGEVIIIDKDHTESLFLIPMDPIATETKRSLAKLYQQIILGFLRRVVHAVFYPVAICTFFFTAVYPTWLNIAISLLYVVMIIRRLLLGKQEPLLKGKITTKDGTAIPYVRVKISEEKTNSTPALLITDEFGTFNARLPQGHYTLNMTKEGYMVSGDALSYGSIYVEHPSHKTVEILMEQESTKTHQPELQDHPFS